MQRDRTEMAMMKRTKMARLTIIASVVTAYWCLSLSMVFINQWQLTTKDFKEVPVFVTLSRCVVAVAVFAVLGHARMLTSSCKVLPLLEYRIPIAKQVAPASLLFVGMILLNNLTVKLLGVAFYNISSLTPVFSAVFSYLILKQRISLTLACCCGVIVSGFLVGVWEDNTASFEVRLWGVLYGVLASMCTALYSILTKQVLAAIENNVFKLQMYNNIHACILLLPMLAATGELSSLRDPGLWASPWFWAMLLLAGGVGLAVGYVASLQILATSPLTHNISIAAKTCVQTVIAYIVFSESKSWLWWAGTVVGLGGSFVYAYFRVLEMSSGPPDEDMGAEKPHLTRQYHNSKKVD